MLSHTHTDEIQRAVQLLETFAPQNIDFSQISTMLSSLEKPKYIDPEVDLLSEKIPEGIDAGIYLQRQKVAKDVDPRVDSLREALNSALRDDSAKNNLSLYGAICNVLHALAKFSPINQVNLFTMEEIDPNYRVVLSKGNQFDIRDIVKWHYESSSLRTHRFGIEDPYDKTPFSPIDVLHIQAIAESKNITIANLKRDPALKLADCLWKTLAELGHLGLTVYHLISLPCPSLSFDQPDALRYLMTQEHLRSIQIPKESFPFSSYFDTLRYLLTKEKNPPLDAIVKLNDFYTQALALEFSPSAYSELVTLIPYGFTVEHLSCLQLYKKDFSGADKSTIYYSILRENNTPLGAIDKLNQFYSQALELELSSPICSELVTLIPYGFTVEDLRRLHIRNGFSSQDIDALDDLLRAHQCDNSVDIFTTFNSFYVPAFELGVPPAFDASYLRRLHRSGITVEHIKKLKMREVLSSEDYIALRLFIDKGYRPDEAVAKLNDFYTQATELGCSPESYARLLSLVRDGMNAELLRSLKMREVFSANDIRALEHLIKYRYSPKEAVAKLNHVYTQVLEHKLSYSYSKL